MNGNEFNLQEPLSDWRDRQKYGEYSGISGSKEACLGSKDKECTSYELKKDVKWEEGKVDDFNKQKDITVQKTEYIATQRKDVK